MAFKIALTNVPFDLDYEETIRFESRNKQYSYFHIPEIFNDCPDVNFHINDGLSAEAIFVDTTNALMSSLNRNYAIIQDNYNNTTKYLFYFIKRVTHESSRKQYKLELYLDVINTYYLDCTFDDCLIERAHLNRFIKNQYGAYVFNFTKSSKLFKNENLDIKLNVYNNKLKCRFNNGIRNTSFAIKKWFDNNVDYWTYYYIRKNNFTCGYYNGNTYYNFISNNIDMPTMYDDIGQPYFVLPVPHYNTNKVIYLHVDGETEWDNVRRYTIDSLYRFIEEYNLSDDILSIKYSRINPFVYLEKDIIMEIDNNNNIKITSPSYIYSGDIGLWQDEPLFLGVNEDYTTEGETYWHTLWCLLYIPIYSVKPVLLEVNETSISSPDGSLIDTGLNGYSKGQIRSNALYPKNKIIAEKIRITDGINNYDIDISIFNCGYIQLYYYENITPDISRIIIEPLPYDTQENFFIERVYNNRKLYNGYVQSIDVSLAFGKTAYDTFIANNKNFYMQRNLQAGVMTAKTMISMAGSYPKMQDVSTKAGLGYMDIMQYTVNSDFALDNIINAPVNIENLNGNGILNIGYNTIDLYVCNYTALETDIKTMNDYFKLFGYAYGELDNIKNIDNIRYYFNFVKAPIRCVHLANNYMSNIVREKIKDIFRKGIIFYNYKAMEEKNVSAFDYTVNNYENEVAENAQ